MSRASTPAHKPLAKSEALAAAEMALARARAMPCGSDLRAIHVPVDRLRRNGSPALTRGPALSRYIAKSVFMG